MAVAIATMRMRPHHGPALRGSRVPVGGLVLSALVHGTLIAAIVLAGYVWRANKTTPWVVNIDVAVAALGNPQGKSRTPEPSLPRVFDPAAARPAPPAPALPEREPVRAPERPARPTDLPDRAPAPRESVALPDRSMPPRTPALPRPGEKELPRVASAPTPPATTGPAGRTPTAPPPPTTLGRATGSPQGSGAVTLSVSDFPFAWYLRAVNDKVSKNWEGKAKDGVQPTIVFEIGRDGQVRALAVEKSSGNPLYDQAALRAIADANPFPQLPPEFPEPFLRVHLGFNYSGNRG